MRNPTVWISCCLSLLALGACSPSTVPACGTQGQPCCDGVVCDTGLACLADVCTVPGGSGNPGGGGGGSTSSNASSSSGKSSSGGSQTSSGAASSGTSGNASSSSGSSSSSGGTTASSSSGAPPSGATGTPCTKNSDCPTDICLPVGQPAGGQPAGEATWTGDVCTSSCTSAAADCVAGWSCAALIGQNGDVCQCSYSPEICDGKDNDCNGIVDDEPEVDEACARQLGTGATCQNGSCVCGSGDTDCGGRCTNTQTDPKNCGGCAGAGGQACPSGQTCVGGGCSSGGASSSGGSHSSSSSGSSSGGSGTLECSTTLNAAELSACDGGVDGCPAGLTCYADPNFGSLCEYTCSTTANCPDLVTNCVSGHCVGNLCGVAGSSGTTNGSYDGTCDAAGTNDGTCFPVDGSGGAAASNGICLQGGSIANGSAPCSANLACGAHDECAAGWFCNSTGTSLTSVNVGTCVQLCNPSGSSTCTGGTTCTSQSTDIGFCQTSSSSSSGGSSSSSSSGGSSGASGGLPGDTCSLCTSTSCTGATDDCVTDPDDATNGYCAPDCYDASTGGANQSVCTDGTQCTELTDDSGGSGDDGAGDDWVCYPASGTCT